jgi:hypothetical protein
MVASHKRTEHVGGDLSHLGSEKSLHLSTPNDLVSALRSLLDEQSLKENEHYLGMECAHLREEK